MTRRLIVVASLFALSGCWASGQLRYRDHPELAKVKVATGEEKGLPEGELGVVTAKAEGYATCDQLIAEALTGLLAEARSLGGSGVQQVKFRRRWYWSGRDPARCRERRQAGGAAGVPAETGTGEATTIPAGSTETLYPGGGDTGLVSPGMPVCRRSLLGSESVEARGVAVK